MQRLDTTKLRLNQIFDNNRPLEVEVGCGKTKFLVQRAQDHPEINFIAFDTIWKFMKLGYTRAQKRQLTNIRFFKTEATDFIGHVLPDESVNRFHIYFPDPWPKRRHRHRRLIDQTFLNLIWRKSAPQGSVQISTDDEDYYRSIREAAQDRACLWSLTRESVNNRLFPATLKTNYEIKYEKEGRKLYYLECHKEPQGVLNG